MSIITCKNLEIKYESRVVLSDTEFDVSHGDYFCIVGENGTGKSTLMKGLLGIKKPSHGEILWNGIKPTEIGYLPQKKEMQHDFPASVFEVVLSGCMGNHKFTFFYSKEDKKKASDNLQKMGMLEFKNTPYSELSGGQQQRVLLARALCAAKKILLLDEPVTGLDPVATNDMYELLEKLNKEHGITIIMISHDVKASVRYGNKILHLEKKPLFFGSAKDYQETEYFEKMIGVCE